MHILRDIYIIADGTVLDYGASVDHPHYRANRCRSMNNSMRINHTVLANLYQFRALKSLLSFIDSFPRFPI